ncbi:MAG: hypothetical protein GX607_07275 [Myxococcales bacterium]|jgi:hypothetical protein|nr:hypothetical protein [Myxococcales bacterium]
MTTTTHDDLTLRRTFGAVAACGLGIAALAALGLGVSWGLSVVAGAALALGNLWALSRAVQNLVRGDGPALPWTLVSVLKFFALLAVTWVLVRSPQLQPLGVALGFGSLPLGIVFGGLFQAPAPPRSERVATEHTSPGHR